MKKLSREMQKQLMDLFHEGVDVVKEQMNEIEELKAERDRWRTVAKMMIAQVDPESPAWAEYWKVQRGE